MTGVRIVSASDLLAIFEGQAYSRHGHAPSAGTVSKLIARRRANRERVAEDVRLRLLSSKAKVAGT